MAKAKKEPDFEDYIAACMEIVQEFRDVLGVETARMMQEKANRPQEFDPQKHAHLHRIRVAGDHFLSALSRQY
jgi:hypothetical protein